MKNEQKTIYVSPQVKTMEINVQSVLCHSVGNEPMREVDYGDGGFGKE